MFSWRAAGPSQTWGWALNQGEERAVQWLLWEFKALENVPTCPRQICVFSNKLDLSKKSSFQELYQTKERTTALRAHNCFSQLYGIYRPACCCIWRSGSRLETIFYWFLILACYGALWDGKLSVSALKLGVILLSCKCYYKARRINVDIQMILRVSHKLWMLI